MIQIGVPPLDPSLTFDMEDFFLQTKAVETNYLGEHQSEGIATKDDCMVARGQAAHREDCQVLPREGCG